MSKLFIFLSFLIQIHTDKHSLAWTGDKECMRLGTISIRRYNTVRNIDVPAHVIEVSKH